MKTSELGATMVREQMKPAVSRSAFLAACFAAMLVVTGCGSDSSSSSGSGSTPATPTFTPAAGTYNAAQTVTISDATQGVALHCTTDGSAPTASSPACSEPTTVSSSQTLSAIAVTPGGKSSSVATAAYTINLTAAAAPVISPAAGTYNAAQTVTITDTTAGASIFYTLDGSTPTSASTAYSGAITVSQTETVTAIAIAPGFTDSALASAAYIINLPAPAPVITPNGGTFTGSQAVTITDPIAGATIYYTVTPAGGTPITPTAQSTVYSGPIPVVSSSTISAIAIAPSYSLSPVTMAAFDIVTATPVISPAGGSFTSLQNVTITDATPGAAIFYTVTANGSTPVAPSTSSVPYTGPIAVSSSETIEAIAVSTGTDQSAVATAAFTISLSPAAAPVISPAGGTFGVAQTVSITDTTTAAAIYYTIDGTAPSASHGALYTGPIQVANTQTVEAVAVASGYTTSPVATANFTINLAAAAVPVISPAGGSFDPSAEPTVTIADATPGATIYYTLDGSLPSASNGAVYTTPILVTVSETIKATAIATGYSLSAAASQTYTINQAAAATPTFSVSSGTYTSAQTVTLADATSGASIYYTLDGTNPSAAHGTLYTGTAISVSSTETIKAIAIASGFNNSAIATATYTINLTPSVTPTISPTPAQGQTYTSPVSVTITTTDSGAIYYTTNGTTPTATNGTRYTTAFSVSSTTTVKAIGIASGHSASTAASQTYTFAATAPVISPSGGTFSTSKSVTITDSTPGVTIYYTVTPGTTGTQPSTASTVYSAPFTITATSTVEAYAVETGFTDSATTTATFTQQTVTGPTVFGTVAGGTLPVNGATVTLYAAGTGGYGSAPTVIGSPVTTDASGSFSIPFTSCPAAPGDLLYVVALGGSTSGSTNSGLGMMTALGACSAVSASTSSITINEVTTIGSVYALAGFAAFDTTVGGIDIGAPTGGGTYTTCSTTTNAPNIIGGSNCNYPGLLRAFATVNNLVSVSDGTALATTPAYGSASTQKPFLNTSTAPQARVNTLANILSSCVDDANGCTTLFSTVSGTTPVDTLQATLGIAQHPGANVATLFGLAPATPPYTPNLQGLGLTTAPVDWTLALTFTGGGLGVDPSDFGDNVINNYMALDASGNVWIAAADPNGGNELRPGCLDVPSACVAQGNPQFVAGFNNLGAPLTPATTYVDTGSASTSYVSLYGGYSGGQIASGPRSIVIDATNNLWVTTGPSQVTEVVVTNGPGGTTFSQPSLPAQPAGGGGYIQGGNSTSVAFDPGGRLWASTTNQEFDEFASTGELINTYQNTALYRFNGYGQSNFTFDTNGSLWSYDVHNGYLDLYNGNLTSTPMTTNLPVQVTPAVQFTGGGDVLAAGPSGYMYSCSADVTQFLIYDSSLPAASNPKNTYTANPGCSSPAVDGDGNFWSLQPGLASIPGITEVSAAGALVTPSGGYAETSSVEEPTNIDGELSAGQMAIDGSGNLWLMNVNNFNPQMSSLEGNVLVEVVGVAAPTITPLSTATAVGQSGLSGSGTRP